MIPGSIRSVLVAITFVVAASSVSAQYDYSHRKSKFEIKVKPNTSVKATLTRNHFGFGGAMNWYLHHTVKAGVAGCTQNYGDVFLKYFDYCTPENEMKWDYVQGGDEELEPMWWKADTIINFCKRNDIAIRGHNLFWNEDTSWIPPWAWQLPSKAEFKDAMKRRIEYAMAYGVEKKVVHWDIINEIIHGYDSNGKGGAKPKFEDLTLVKYSGDNNIFTWILDEARKIDPKSKFTINDYGMETDNGNVTDYINRCKPLGNKFDIVGMEGHFGTSVFNKNDLNTRINKLANDLSKEVGLTEVDWEYNSSQGPNKMDELMRTCFSNPKVGGLIIWTWCKRHMWRDKLTSFFVDSLMNETETGKKWAAARAEWKTDTSGTTDGEGNFKFSGYQGKYRFVVGTDTMIVYLHPGDRVEVLDSGKTDIRVVTSSKENLKSIRFNGSTIKISVKPDENRPLYLTTYSISGKLISRLPLNFVNGTASVAKLPSGCHVYRIGTSTRLYYTGMGVDIR